MYFKLMSSHMNPRFKMISSPTQEETVLLQIEAEQSKTFVPKRLKWNEITIPEEFKIENSQNTRDIVTPRFHRYGDVTGTYIRWSKGAPTYIR